MKDFKHIKILQQYTYDDVIYGTYFVNWKGGNYLFIRTDEKVAVASHLQGKLPDKSLSMLRDDVTADFLKELKLDGWNVKNVSRSIFCDNTD